MHVTSQSSSTARGQWLPPPLLILCSPPHFETKDSVFLGMSSAPSHHLTVKRYSQHPLLPSHFLPGGSFPKLTSRNPAPLLCDLEAFLGIVYVICYFPVFWLCGF